MNRYPPPEEIRSGEQQKKLYLTAIKEIAHLRNMVKAENNYQPRLFNKYNDVIRNYLSESLEIKNE